jgi:hypothetical protein
MRKKETYKAQRKIKRMKRNETNERIVAKTRNRF